MQLMGYFPKQIELRPEWLKASGVMDICSVSECVSQGPQDWIQLWRHNEWWLYSTIPDAISVIPQQEADRFTLFAYQFESMIYHGGESTVFNLPDFDIQPLPNTASSLGFDVVSRSMDSTFECSPLSCNHMAEEITVNSHCLIDTLAKAREVAIQFSIEEPEPGPYFVAEIIQIDDHCLI